MEQVAPEQMTHALWGFSNALFFMILLVVFLVVAVMGANAAGDIKRVKDDWATYRCQPMVMPFASLFGHDAKENFEFCLGKIFTGHSQSYLGSIANIFTQFTSILQTVFQSVGSLRNVIASLGGGINVILQEFTERISLFFFRLRLSAIHLKSLFMRMYAILFSVMYMGMSGITGMTSFTNTFLFSFLDTFCFPGETPVYVRHRGFVPIREVRMGDWIGRGESSATWTRVTATFHFEARGQEMVRLGDITVSTNHYVKYNGHYLRAEHHPAAVRLGPWTSSDYLYCLNTDTHRIPLGLFTFMDYDETAEGDERTMQMVEDRVNGRVDGRTTEDERYRTMEETAAETAGMVMAPHTLIRMNDHSLKRADEVCVGDSLATGATVAGVIRKEVQRVCRRHGATTPWFTPTTLQWFPSAAADASLNENSGGGGEWRRLRTEWTTECLPAPTMGVSFVVTPNSQIELEDGTRIRDYMELCSPDSEYYYAKQIELRDHGNLRCHMALYGVSG